MPDVSPLLVPQMNVNDEQAVIVAWLVSSGTRVTAEQPVATLETTKATFDVHAHRDGFIVYEHEVKSVITVGTPLAFIADEPLVSIPRVVDAPSSSADAAMAGDERFTRKALKRMRELNLRPEDFPQSGRIEVADVEALAQRRSPSTTNRSERTDRFAHCEPLDESPSKLIEAARLSAAYRAIVPSSVTVPLNVARVQARLQRLAAQHGPVSLLEVTVYEVARLLSEFPELNGFFAEGRGWRYRDIVIGFAVNAGRGLKVPVVRDAATLPLLEVARTMRDLTLRCFRDELKMDDVAGGTFTVTDLSGYGVTQFTPVINDAQAAILGLCAERPNGGHQDLVLCFDHRLSDGMRAAQFLGALCERLESEGAD